MAEPDHDVLGKVGHQLCEVASIDDVLDDSLHVVGLVGVGRNDVGQEF